MLVGDVTVDQVDPMAGTQPGGYTTDGGVNPIGGGYAGSEATPPTSYAGADIVGKEVSEQLYGTDLGEKIFGKGGNDVLTGYAGKDTFDGGLGSDTVDYSYQPATVPGLVRLDDGTGQGTGSAFFDGFYTEILNSIENVWMGAGNDTVVGDSNDNDLRGGPGNDTLQGGLGSDKIYGDWKYKDLGGVDTAVLSYTFGVGYTVSGSANAMRIIGADGDDWFYNVENFEFSDGVIKAANDVLQPRSYDYTIFDYPFPYRTFAADINNSGQIALNTNAGGSAIYDVDTGTFTPVPSGIYARQTSSINDMGDIIGQWSTDISFGYPLSFLYTNDTFSDFRFTNSSGGTAQTRMSGINNLGEIVGSYAYGFTSVSIIVSPISI